mmetsp:Transcript_44427/g.128586  ORF Transcript_44427/g.128586 Transcript_44427/m.128586 type:complete len:336 (+) Transcript_44427:51-1058(+)
MDEAGGGDSDAEVEDTSEKYTDTSVTLEDLRKHDQAWEPLPAEQRRRFHSLIKGQIAYFGDKPYIDSCQHNVGAYTRQFLAQPGAYGWSLDFNADLFCELAYEGFLSTSLEIPAGGDSVIQVMLPWIDPKRNSLDFHEMHISKQVRKRAKQYTMTVDTAYDDVMLGCIRQHGEGWLYRGLRWLLRRLFKEGYRGSRSINVGVHSLELWSSDGELVAGDLGYTVGGVYTSMTGFRKQDTRGAGEVQLVLTGALLHKMGYDWWDLGMVMKYKARLGARVISREAFISRLHGDRNKPTRFAHERCAGQELLGHLQRLQQERRSAAGDPEKLRSSCNVF